MNEGSKSTKRATVQIRRVAGDASQGDWPARRIAARKQLVRMLAESLVREALAARAQSVVTVEAPRPQTWDHQAGKT